MKGLESPVKKRARLSLKKREQSLETPSPVFVVSTSSCSGSVPANTTTTTTSTTASETAPATPGGNVVSTTIAYAVAAMVTPTSDVTDTTATGGEQTTEYSLELPQDKETSPDDINNDVISINSDDVYESMPIVAALENLDNTCFLNSVLQILRYTPWFLHGLNELCYKVARQAKSSSEDASGSSQVWELALAISEMFKQMSALERKVQGLSSVSSANIALKPDRVQNVVRKLNSMFEGSAQHDAQEFLQFILYQLQEAEKLLKKSVVATEGTENFNYSALPVTPPSSRNVATSTVAKTDTTNSTATSITQSCHSNDSPTTLNSTEQLTHKDNFVATNNVIINEENSLHDSQKKITSGIHKSKSIQLSSSSNFSSVVNSAEPLQVCTKPPPPSNEVVEASKNNLLKLEGLSTSLTEFSRSEQQSPSCPSRLATPSPTKHQQPLPCVVTSSNHCDQTNGISLSEDTAKETNNCTPYGNHFVFKAAVFNGETDGESNSSSQTCVSTTAQLPLPISQQQRTPSPQTARYIPNSNSSAARLNCSSPSSQNNTAPATAAVSIANISSLQNGMSKNQVKQIRNAIVKLEKCDLVCNSPQKSVNAYYAIECLNTGKAYKSKKKDFVEQLFLGTILSRTRCLECEKSSEKHEEFLEVSVPLNKTSNHLSDGESSDPESEDNSDRDTLISFISSFSEVEKLQGDNKYYCDSCYNYVEADRSLHYDTLPDILTVHLKRFSASSEFGLMCKINDHVDVPLSLPCLLYKCPKNCFRQDHRYTLFGIITHAGYTISSGHYVAYVKTSASSLTWHFPSSGPRESSSSNEDSNSPGSDLQPDGDIFWLECDDSSVRVFTEEDFLERLSSEGLLTGTPYLLFYHKSPMSRSL